MISIPSLTEVICLKFEKLDILSVSGTLEERGILAWQAELGVKQDDTSENTIPVRDEIRNKKLMETIYTIPYINKILQKIPGLSYVPICPPFDAYN